MQHFDKSIEFEKSAKKLPPPPLPTLCHEHHCLLAFLFVLVRIYLHFNLISETE
jgi:hypothetical protein